MWEVKHSRKINISDETSRCSENEEIKRCGTYFELIRDAHDLAGNSNEWGRKDKYSSTFRS